MNHFERYLRMGFLALLTGVFSCAHSVRTLHYYIPSCELSGSVRQVYAQRQSTSSQRLGDVKRWDVVLNLSWPAQSANVDSQPQEHIYLPNETCVRSDSRSARCVSQPLCEWQKQNEQHALQMMDRLIRE